MDSENKAGYKVTDELDEINRLRHGLHYIQRISNVTLVQKSGEKEMAAALLEILNETYLLLQPPSGYVRPPFPNL